MSNASGSRDRRPYPSEFKREAVEPYRRPSPASSPKRSLTPLKFIDVAEQHTDCAARPLAPSKRPKRRTLSIADLPRFAPERADHSDPLPATQDGDPAQEPTRGPAATGGCARQRSSAGVSFATST